MRETIRGSSLSLALILGITIGSLFEASAARAQAAPPVARASDSGYEGRVNATGGYSTSIPLDLPATRDGLAIPLSIVSGGHSVGAAGLGWDVPLAYIRNDYSIAKRKPLDANTVQGRQHVTLSLAGANIDLVRKNYNAADPTHLWVSRRDQAFFTAIENGTSWTVFDGEGHRYEFATAGVDADAGLALLKTVWDSGGVELMELGYNARNVAVVSGQPPQTFSVDLKSISYNFHPDMGCAKDEIDLAYDDSRANPLSASALSGHLYFRDHVLTSVTVQSRSSCVAATTLRTYELVYDGYFDTDTGLPRLVQVLLHGRTGTAEATSPLTLATFTYNHVTSDYSLTYQGVSSTAAMPAGTHQDGISQEVVMPQSTSDRTWYATTQDLIDMTGDGIPDFVFLNGGVLFVARGSAKVGGGITFGTPVQLGDSAVTIPDGLRIHAIGHDHSDADHAGDHVTYDRDRVWRTTLDVNGDGRMDIVDAQEEKNHWTVYLNTPSTGPSGVTWAKRSIPIQALLNALSDHDRGDGVHLELERRFTGSVMTVDYEHDNLTGVGDQSTYTEWELKDVNGDGLPDFVFDDHSVYFVGQYDGTISFVYTPTLDRANQVKVAFDVGGITLDPAPGGVQPIYADPITILDHSTSCGIEEWTGQALTCALVDITGDGILDRLEYESSGPSPEFKAWAGLGQSFSPMEIPRLIGSGISYGSYGLDPNHCDTDSGSSYIEGVLSLIRDVTGDGIPDLVGTSEVYVGTGFGFRPEGLPTHGVAISWQQRTCDGSSKTIKGLYDVDGDGRPEQVSVDGVGNINIVPPIVEDAPAPIGSGQISRVSNAYGASTSITYRSAKEDTSTPHQVAFPEVVVSSTSTSAPSQPTMATTSYAYGNASMLFDNIAGGFVFSGYRRTVEMTTITVNGGQFGAAGAVAEGQATITDTLGEPAFQPGMTDDQRFARRMAVGRISSIATLAGSFSTDANALLTVAVASDPRVNGLTIYLPQTKLFTENAAPGEGSLDCFDIVDPYDYQASLAYVYDVYDTCSAHGFTYTSAALSARGSISSTAHVTTMTLVKSVDDYARPLEVLYENDATRADDDLCVDTTYASSIGAVSVLGAKATRKTSSACNPQGTVASVYGNETFQYDNYPTGTVDLGRMTSMTTERHAADDGTLLAPTIHVFDATYDVVGNPSEVVSVRDDGAVRQTTYSYDAFGLAPTQTQVAASGLTNIVTTTTYDLASMMAASREDANGTVTSFAYDGFDRPVKTAIAPNGSAPGVLSTTSYLGFTDGTGRRIVSTTYDDPVADPASVPGHASTVYIDELGRASHTESSLGSSYSDQTLVTYDSYDPFGRLSFASEPFLGTDEPTTAMGTTHYYNLDGTPSCNVRARGPHDFTAITSTPSDVYATCYYHAYAAGTEVFGASAPDANEPGSPQYGVLDMKSATAIGRPISQFKSQGGGTIEDSDYTNDHLGNVTSITRYQVTSPLSYPVTTSWRYDSAHNKISEQEPEAALQKTTYDSWGESTLTEWVDSGTTHDIAATYDALGRTAHREERNAGVVDKESVFDYVYDAPFTVSPEVTPTNTHGRLTRATGPESTIYLSYDGYGAVNAETHVDPSGDRYVEKTTRHANGNIASIDLYAPDTGYKNEHVDYTYDSASRSASVTYAGPTSATSLFKAASIDVYGNLLDATFGEKTRYQAIFDTTGRRLQRQAEVSSSYGSRMFKYEGYDAVGRDTADIEVNSDHGETDATHVYDALGRISTAQRTGATPASWTYTYDPLGNLIRTNNALSTTDGVNVRGDTVDEDRICSVAYQGSAWPRICNFTYDAVGNVTNEALRTSARTLKYFNDGSVKQIASPTGKATFNYGPLGGIQNLAVEGTNGRRETRHYGDIFEVRDDRSATDSASFIERKIPGPGMAASLRGAAGSWVLAFGDGRGLRLTTDLYGKFLQDVSYTPYGNASSTGESLGSSDYSTERWNDGDGLETIGLVSVGARIYDPVIGRFLSRDPIRRIYSANAANPYAFADNDPINKADPTGMCTEDCQSGDSGNGPIGDPWATKGTDVSPTPPAAPSVAPPASSFPDDSFDGAGTGSYGDESQAYGRAHEPKHEAWSWSHFGRGAAVGTVGLVAPLEDMVRDQNPAVKFLAVQLFGQQTISQRVQTAIAPPVSEQDDSYFLGQFVPLLVGAFATDGESLFADAAPEFEVLTEGKKIESLAGEVNCGPGGCSCFAPDTPIATEHGLVPIQDVHPSDLVWSRNPVSGETELRPVVRQIVTPDKALLDLEFVADSGKVEIVRATATHPFWVDGRGWILAGDLKPGDVLDLRLGAHTTFERSQREPTMSTVYNLEVEGDHTYFVGDDGIWVHNAPWCTGAPKDIALNHADIMDEYDGVLERDWSGKLHGDYLPDAKDFGKYSREELEMLQDGLEGSIRERAAANTRYGHSVGHAERQAFEQRTLRQLTKYLGDH